MMNNRGKANRLRVGNRSWKLTPETKNRVFTELLEAVRSRGSDLELFDELNVRDLILKYQVHLRSS